MGRAYRPTRLPSGPFRVDLRAGLLLRGRESIPLRRKTWPEGDGFVRQLVVDSDLCFVRWPGHVAPGSTSCAMFSEMDFLPTFAAMLRVKLPTDRPIDGVDQTAVLRRQERNGGPRVAADVHRSGSCGPCDGNHGGCTSRICTESSLAIDQRQLMTELEDLLTSDVFGTMRCESDVLHPVVVAELGLLA